MINEVRLKFCVTLNGKPPELGDQSQVSGLDIWQKKYLERLRSMGLDLVELYFAWGNESKIERLSSQRYILHLDKAKRTFQMENEALGHGLSYPLDAKNNEEILLNLLSTERVEALIVIGWISSGMMIWQTCLHFGKPVIFIPTEHAAVCHLGFFLNPLGTACTGPESGMKCAKCTHGIEPYSSLAQTKAPWYSRRFQLFFRLTTWFPERLQKHAIWILAELFSAKDALLSKKQGVARLQSARRFLQHHNVSVLFQSSHQHKLFERAIKGSIRVRTEFVIAPNRDLVYDSLKDTRSPSIQHGRVYFLFAARSSFDRGLYFLLVAWAEMAHLKNIFTLIVRCDQPGSIIVNQLSNLQSSGFDIDVAYGKLTDEDFVHLHRKIHFVVNPAMWEEPLAGAVIEGFDLGTPAIVPTDTGSSCFVQSGQNGYLFEFRNKCSLIKCIETAIHDIDSWKHLQNGALATSKRYRLLSNIQLEYVRSIASGGSSFSMNGHQ